MSYEKQTWSTGETITANKLNHIEDGIADGGSGGGSDVFIVHVIADYSESEEEPSVIVEEPVDDIFNALSNNKEVVAFVRDKDAEGIVFAGANCMRVFYFNDSDDSAERVIEFKSPVAINTIGNIEQIDAGTLFYNGNWSYTFKSVQITQA